jgi:hypothetical protein
VYPDEEVGVYGGVVIGSSRLLFKKYGSAWASRRSDTGQRRPSGGPLLRCWDSSRWLPSLLTST